MDQHTDPKQWYDTSAANDWYRQSAVTTTAAVPAKKPRKKRTAMKIAMIILCVLVLAAAAVAAFAPRFTAREPGETSDADVSVTTTPDSGAVIPDNALPGVTTPDQYEDFHEFFNNYFTEEELVVGSNLPKAPNGTGVVLPLEDSAGLQPLTLGEIYAKGAPSVVGIMATDPQSAAVGSYYWGTGIIMTEDGYILTNTHVISGTTMCSVILSDGTEYEAKLVGDDTQSDIAVLKIDATGLPAASFGDSSQLQVGDEVVAIGNPLGEYLTGTMTNGIVSAINRGIVSNGHTMTLIQTNAALNEGNSGGPLFNMYGQVIGITNMKMAADYTQVTIEGIGFAIPTVNAKTIIDQLIEKGIVSGRPGIGITVGAVPTAATTQWNLPYGLYIMEVVEGSDAYAKGLRPGDILMAVNGTEVYTTDDVNLMKEGFGVGETLTFTIFREGETFDVDVALVDMNELY